MIFGLKFGRREQPKKRSAIGTLKPYDQRKIKEDWGKVEQLVQVGKPSALKEAVVIADKLLDYTLSQISFGETVGERLKNAKEAFARPTYQGLWEAHKVRNALVHDSDYDLTQLVARDALSKFKVAFKALGVELPRGEVIEP